MQTDLASMPEIQTVLSDVRGEQGELVILGWPLAAWVEQHTYAACAQRLWSPFSPDLSLSTLVRDLGQARLRAYTLLAPRREELSDLPVFAALCLALQWASQQPELQHPAGLSTALGMGLVLHLNPEAPAPAAEAEHIQDLWRLLTGKQADTAGVLALTRYLVCVSEHGLNASTFTARVIASTGAELVSCLQGALGALQGPLHGGAPGPVLDMLDQIGEPQTAWDWLVAQSLAGQRIMGFGHRIYRERDPRADVLKATLLDLQQTQNTQRLQQAEAIEAVILAYLAQHKPQRALKTNVEYYTALLLEALGFERQTFTAVFALGRVLGWVAHVLEQRQDGRLIRPLSTYVGPQPEALSERAIS